MSWWWIIGGIALVLFIRKGIRSYLYIGRCMEMMPTDSFISPCEIVALHLSVYGKGLHRDPMNDTMFLRGAFQFQEIEDNLVSMPRYDGACHCPRVYKLSPNAALKREREGRFPQIVRVTEADKK